MVERIGRERLLSAVYKVIESDWGGIILQSAENPYSLDINKRRRIVREVKEDLGFIG